MKAKYNFGTFSTCQMSSKADKAFMKYAGYNIINRNEYPDLVEKELHIGNELLRSVLGRDTDTGLAQATTGSTESALLVVRNALLSNKDIKNPIVILNENNHHSWNRVFVMLGVTPHYYLTNYNMEPDPKELREVYKTGNVILNVMCNHYTTSGRSDKLNYLYDMAKEFNVDSHLDAAISGYTNVRTVDADSVNISSHKMGGVYPGLGFLLFNRKDDVSKEMYFETSYLKDKFSSMGFSFTKSAGHIAAHYEDIESGRLEFNLKKLNKLSNKTHTFLANILGYDYVTLRNNCIYISSEHIVLNTTDKVSVPLSSMKYKGTSGSYYRIVMSHGKDKNSFETLLNNLQLIKHNDILYQGAKF